MSGSRREVHDVEVHDVDCSSPEFRAFFSERENIAYYVRFLRKMENSLPEDERSFENMMTRLITMLVTYSIQAGQTGEHVASQVFAAHTTLLTNAAVEFVKAGLDVKPKSPLN